MSELNKITGQVLNSALHIHSALGPGLFESAYGIVLAHDLREVGLKVERQKAVPITYKNLHLRAAFRADLVVEDSVIVEIKSVPHLVPVHSKQLLTYLRLMDYRVGLLINFGEDSLMDGFKRIVNRF